MRVTLPELAEQAQHAPADQEGAEQHQKRPSLHGSLFMSVHGPDTADAGRDLHRAT